MSIQENIRLDDENIAAWNARDIDRALAVLSDNILWSDAGSPQPFQGKEAVRQYMQDWFSAWPDLKLTVTNRVATEDQVAGELELTATNTVALQLMPGAPAIPPTGRKVRIKGTYFGRVQDGKFMEVRTYPDTAGLLMQLGVMAVSDS